MDHLSHSEASFDLGYKPGVLTLRRGDARGTEVVIQSKDWKLNEVERGRERKRRKRRGERSPDKKRERERAEAEHRSVQSSRR